MYQTDSIINWQIHDFYKPSLKWYYKSNNIKDLDLSLQRIMLVLKHNTKMILGMYKTLRQTTKQEDTLSSKEVGIWTSNTS